MKKFLIILQILLKLSLVFLISLIWLRFFLKSIWLSVLISLGITLLFEVVHRYFQKKSKTQTSLKLKEKEDAENIFFSLATNGKYLKFFEDMLKSRHSNIITKKSFIIIEKDNQKTILYPYFKLAKFQPENLIEILKEISSVKANKITIICYDYDKDILPFINNFEQEINLIDKYQSYALYKEYDFYPEITMQYKKEASLTFKSMLAIAFNRSRTKGYFLSAIILFITSFFIKTNIYYCVISSVLLIFALISYINPKYNKKNFKELI